VLSNRIEETGTQRVLVRHHLVAIPAAGAVETGPAALATVAANIAYYGYALARPAYEALARAGDGALARWWTRFEPVLAQLTGDDKRMDRFVVYKNFPAEVLAMDEVSYWSRQILMYWGLPSEYVTEEERDRPTLSDAPAARVLHLADAGSLPGVLASLCAVPARWTDDQWADVGYLIDGPVDLTTVPFVENRIRLAALMCDRGLPATVDSATDVLRLAVALSDGDVSLRRPGRLRRLARRERRFLLALLDGAKNLDEDVARRRERFKRLMRELRPGDYRAAFPRVVAAYDRLYRAEPVRGFNSDVERLLAARDPAVLTLLATRPGEYARRLRMLVLTFGAPAVELFRTLTGRLSVIQLLKLRGFLSTVDGRRWRMFPPRGNWSRVQVVSAGRLARLPVGLRDELLGAIGAELTARLEKQAPVALSPAVARVKLPTNDAELAPYGRGTVFPIPAGMTFLRTASYWKFGGDSPTGWYDNGWNFFDAGWKPVGVCSWDQARFGGGAKSGAKTRPGAVFSGDPVSAQDREGRATQLIDLYLDRLPELRVRYAVWSVLCYSRMTFSQAQDVFAALQWGENPEAGKLFEPSRCQLAFPLTGETYTKFVAYVDVASRELVYLDANLPVSVQSAAMNGERLSVSMPAYLEYLASLPSVHDLYRHAPASDDGMPVLYDDADFSITGGPAYVFRPSNPANNYEAADPAALL
jgi:hypothetical protein